MTFHDTIKTFEITLEKEVGDWLLQTLELLSPHREKNLTFAQVRASFESHCEEEDFELFWFSKPMRTLSTHGLLVV